MNFYTKPFETNSLNILIVEWSKTWNLSNDFFCVYCIVHVIDQLPPIIQTVSHLFGFDIARFMTSSSRCLPADLTDFGPFFRIHERIASKMLDCLYF